MNSKVLCLLQNDPIPLLSDSNQKLLSTANSVVQNIISERITESWPGQNEDNDDEFTNKVRLVENNMCTIIKILRKGRFSSKNYKKVYPKWKKINDDSIQKLKEIANSINIDRFNCNLSKIVGGCTSLLGGALTVGSAALTVASGGLAAPLFYAGVAATAAGVSATFGTSVTEVVLLKNKVEEAQEIMKKDREYFNKMNEWLIHAREMEEAIEEVLNIDIFAEVATAVEKLIDDVLAIPNEFKRFGYLEKSINAIFKLFPGDFLEAGAKYLPVIGTLITVLMAFYLLIKHRDNRIVFASTALTIRSILGIASLMDDALDSLRLTTIFRGSPVLAKAAVRGAVALVGIAIDIASIIITSIDVHKGSRSPQAKKILDACKEMEKEAQILETVFHDLHRF